MKGINWPFPMLSNRKRCSGTKYTIFSTDGILHSGKWRCPYWFLESNQILVFSGAPFWKTATDARFVCKIVRRGLMEVLAWVSENYFQGCIDLQRENVHLRPIRYFFSSEIDIVFQFIWCRILLISTNIYQFFRGCRRNKKFQMNDKFIGNYRSIYTVK